MEEKIDFVITWVDGNDPAWLKERNHYAVLENEEIDNNACRFRDWGTLRYWFRGVEKFAPWVNKIFFVTWGHIPDWLKTDNPKLEIVRHNDFIPVEYLPTFHSDVIEFHFHKVKGLADHFVYFNDDTFLIDKVTPERFFRRGLPCDMGVMISITKTGIPGTAIYLANNLINDHFNKRESIKRDFFKWFNIDNASYLFRNMIFYFIAGNLFAGFHNHHLPQGYLKNTYDEVWTSCEKELLRTIQNKFRQYGDVSHWLIRYWQLASGSFSPYNVNKDGTYYCVQDNNISDIIDCIRQQKKSLICLNDTELTTHFENLKNGIINAFEMILPEKSSFEI